MIFSDPRQIERLSLLPTREGTAYDVPNIKGLGWYNFEADDVTDDYDRQIGIIRAQIADLATKVSSSSPIIKDKYQKIIECRKCTSWRCRRDCGKKYNLGIGDTLLKQKLEILYQTYKMMVGVSTTISSLEAKVVQIEKDKAAYIKLQSQAGTAQEKEVLQTQERKKMASEKVGVQIKNWGLIAIGAIAIIFLVRQIIKK